MAKQQQETDVKKMLEKLFAAIKTTSEFSREQVKINRDLLKVMSLLNDGFAKNAQDAQDLIADVTDGVEDADKFFQKWAKQRGATKQDLETIRKKFREIDDINDDIIEGSKDYIDLLKERHEYLDDEVDLGKSLLKNHNEIIKAIREGKSAATKLSSQFNNMDEALRDMVAKKVDFTGMFDDSFSSADKVQSSLAKMNQDIEGMIHNVSGNYFNMDLNFNPLTGELDNEIKNVLGVIEEEKNARIAGLSEYFEKNKYLQTQLSRQLAAQSKGLDIKINVDTGEVETINGILKRGSVEYQKMIDSLDKVVEKTGLMSQLSGQFEEITNLVKIGTDRTEEQSQRLNQLLKPLGMATEMLVKQVESKRISLDTDAAMLMKQKEAVELTGKYMGKMKGVEQVIQRVGRGFDYVNALLPAGISDFLGLGQASEQMLMGHRRGVEAFTSKLKDGVTYSEAMKGYMSALRPSIVSLLNPTTILVAGFALLYGFVDSLVNKYKDMQKEMGVSLNQAKEILNVQLDTLTSQKNQFGTMKDIQEVQTAIIGSSGKVFSLTKKDAKELTIDLIEIGKYFGYGNEQAVELHKTFKMLGADDKLSLTLQKNVGYFAEMAGLSATVITKDLIESADTVATYFAGMPDKAAQAAIEVRKVGMSLKQAGSIAQKMLDLEGFMTDMYELYAMSGRGIDFSEAFDLGLSGDLEGMAKSMVNQIGTMNDLNAMSPHLRMKIAKTMGIETNELANMVRMNEEMGSLGSDQQKWLEKNYGTMGDISQLSKKELQNRIAQGMSTDRLGVAWEKIKGVLFKALIPLAEAFGEAIDAISPILDILLLAFKGIAPIIKIVGLALKSIIQLTDAFFGLFGMGSNDIEKIASGIDEIGGTLGEVMKAAIGLVEVFAGTAILKSFGLIKMNAWDLVKMIPNIGSIFSKTSKEVEIKSQEVSANVQQSVQSSVSAQVQTAQTAKQTLEQTANAVKGSTTKMSKDVETTVKKTKDEISKPTTLGISADGAKKGFKLFGDIASKSLTALAIHSASSFLFMKKEGEQQTSELTSNMGSMFGSLALSLAPMLMGSLQEGLERTFTKRMEKKLEGSLENPIKKASKAFGSMDSESGSVFKRILDKGKSVFSSLGNFSKKLSGVPSVTGSFDAMASSVDKVIPKAEMVSEVVEKVKKTKKTETAIDVEPSKPVKETTKKVGSSFDGLTSMFKSVWNGIKTVLNDLVKFVSDSMKTLSSGIGTTIKNILKGIGDGLNSFKTGAIKGAASLVILSGALWVTSKAVQNFASVKWEDLAKAGVALGGLAGVALTLGSASGQMIVGAAAIAVLGASLIPAALALKMFNDIEWSSLGKAGVALVGLAVSAGVLGAIMMSGVGAVALTLGAVAIAGLGASLIPLAAALAIASPALEKISPIIDSFGGVIKTTFEGISQVISTATSGIVKIFSTLGQIDVGHLFSIGPALGSVAFGLTALSASLAGSSMMNGISKMFGGDIVKDLEKLAELANPLYIAAKAIGMLGENISSLGQTLTNVDFSQLAKIEDVTLDTKVQQKIKPILNAPSVPRDSTNVKISPIQIPVAQPQPPNKVSVAQDKLLNPKEVAETQMKFNGGFTNKQNEDIYGGDVLNDNQETNMLLRQMIQLMELLVRKDSNTYMDAQKVTATIKAKLNN